MKISMSTRMTALMALLAATSGWAQAPQAQGSAGMAAQGSASAEAPRQGGAQAAAEAGARGGAAASGPAGETGTALASGSSVNAVLVKPVDSAHSKPGDPVSARTMQAVKTEDGTTIPAGSQLVGHIAEAPAGATGAAGSSIGIVFDRALMKGGHEVPLRHVGIRALAAAESAATLGAGEGSAMMGASGGMGGGARGGLGGGGLVGRTGGAVGGTLGGAVNGAGSLGASGLGALQAGPGAVGGLDASGALTSQSRGVFGLRGISLASDAVGSSGASVVSSPDKRLRLDQGTRLLLDSSASASKGDAPGSKSPPARSEPDRR
jgi:hypothetical protein